MKALSQAAASSPWSAPTVGVFQITTGTAAACAGGGGTKQSAWPGARSHRPSVTGSGRISTMRGC